MSIRDIIRCNLALYFLGIYQVLENIVENLSGLLQLYPWQKRKCPDLNGTVALVTGANRGIGKCIAIELAECGCHVILACRNSDEALNISQGMDSGASSIVDIDLSRFDSVLRCAQKLKGRKIDFVVCNAGIMAPPDCARTIDGYEMQTQVNSLSHVLLVHALLRQGSIRNSTDSRIVFFSSFASYGASIFSSQDILAGLTCRDVSYHPKVQYANTKLLNILVALDLQNAIKNIYSTTATIFSMNPGVVDTELARNFCRNEFPNWIRPCTDCVLNALFHLTLRRPQNVARGLLQALRMSPDDIGGRYISIRPSGRVLAKTPAKRAILTGERIFQEFVRKID
jgi:NAD(P)-dependent dehydrogenase (short-subunit alcohol dehydrogenase family)